MNHNSIPVRVDETWLKKMREIATLRIKNDIDKKFRSPKELTKMSLNCPSINKILKELSTLPKKEDLR